MWIQKVTCVWSTFAPWDDETKGTIWGSDELEEEGPIRESMGDPAHRTCDSGGKYIFNIQGLELRAIRAVTGEI